MMYALVEIKGKQYKVEKDSVLRVDHLDSEQGSAVEFPSVVLLKDDAGTKIGTPYVDGAVVKAEVEDHTRDRKVVVFKHKRRKNYRRTKGHRQHYSTIRVKEIAGA